MVLVPVSENQRRDAVPMLLQIRQVRGDEVDTREFGFRKRHAGIDHDERLAKRERHQVHAELTEPAKGHDFERRAGGLNRGV